MNGIAENQSAAAASEAISIVILREPFQRWKDFGLDST